MTSPTLSASLPRWALGIMSGTSLDAIDMALIRTDGIHVQEHGAWASTPLPESMREALRGVMHGQGDFLAIERGYTLFVADCITHFLSNQPLPPQDIAIIGFHGQTMVHRPDEGLTWQLGNAALLAERTHLPVMADFRRRDMAAGGQGAPLVPLYHQALSHDLPKPLAVVNIGGIANITWLGDGAEDVLACDTGTGNALLNDWVASHTGEAYDPEGQYARAGTVQESILTDYLAHPYFAAPPPKSLDRHSFTLEGLRGVSLEDGAATLTAFSAEGIAQAASFFPRPVRSWLVCGGGRHNATLMQMIKQRVHGNVLSCDTLGWHGDALEAEAFAYLAVRAKRGLPLSLPTTTGATHAVTGGAFYSR
jgi:anhydro-N-acetylmuramic acid kinase